MGARAANPESFIKATPTGWYVIESFRRGRHDNKGCFLAVEQGRRLVFTDALSEGYFPQQKPFMSGFVELSDDGDGTLMIWGARHFGEAEVRQHLDMGFRDGWRASAEQLEALARSL